MEEPSGWPSASRSTGAHCGRWRTGCWARSGRPMTPCRTRGCASAGPAGRGREPRRVVDDDRRARLSEHAAFAQRGVARSRSGCTYPTRSSAPTSELQPEDEAVLADSVGLALLVVLDTLTPAERLAFVLHDMFELPFEEIAPMVGRSPVAARQLASRARRRVKGADVPEPDPDLRRQRAGRRRVLPAPRAAATSRRWSRVLDPDVVLRADFGAVATQASTGGPRRGRPSPDRRAAYRGAEVHPALVNGAAGAVVTPARPAVRGHGLHRHGRQDRGDRRDPRTRNVSRGSPRRFSRATSRTATPLPSAVW